MEYNYNQQHGGEVSEETSAGPFGGEAVAEDDAGLGGWGEPSTWDLPQEQQGVVEGGYDPGMYDEGYTDPGTAYDPGFIPEGEYGSGSDYDPGFTPSLPEDEPLYEEPVDAPAADPSDVAPIDEAIGNTGVDTTVDENDIEMLSDDAGGAEIEMSPTDIGGTGADTSVDENNIEMLPDDAGQAGEDPGEGESEDTEPTPDQADEETGDGGTETSDDESARLEAIYGKMSDGNHPRFAFSSEEYLADYYKELYKQLNGSDHEPDMSDLDTYDELRTGVYKLWEQRDNIFETSERSMDAYYREWFQREFGYDLGEDVDWREYSKYITGTETTPDDAGQAGDDSKVDEDDIEMLPDDATQTGDAGGVGIEMSADKQVGPYHIGYPREVSEEEARARGLDADPKGETEGQPRAGAYEAEVAEDPGLQTYDQLADYFKNLAMVLHDGTEPDMAGLDTYEKLKVKVYDLMRERDEYLEQREGEQHLETKSEGHTSDSDGLSTLDPKDVLGGSYGDASGVFESVGEGVGQAIDDVNDFSHSFW